MAIISQKAVKHDFIGPLDKNQRKNLRSFDYFYAKQTQLLKSQMNVNPYNTTDYKNKWQRTLGENKPNSNPIKPNFQKAKMNLKLLATKDYENKPPRRTRKNKPNSNPIKANSPAPKLRRLFITLFGSDYAGLGFVENQMSKVRGQPYGLLTEKSEARRQKTARRGKGAPPQHGRRKSEACPERSRGNRNQKPEV